MRYEFRTSYADSVQVMDADRKPLSPFAVFADRDNFIQDGYGLHLFCRNFAGAGFEIKNPKQYGLWQARTRISAGVDLTHTTKICTLLWEAQGEWKVRFGEIDYNESGDRTLSNQTEHYPPDNKMHHTHYPADQLNFHTYGVLVGPSEIVYFYDGQQQGPSIPNEHTGKWWNQHLRAEPRDDHSETRLDVRWIEVPD